ncbi:hypothetical protein BDR03DRAFT_962645 [Suillus americanus]|nr:hypothetical protein BDR03DRAFT_962645 [Suillus americanus]
MDACHPSSHSLSKYRSLNVLTCAELELVISVCTFTSAVKLRQPRDPQQAVCVHVQTLANFIDRWLPNVVGSQPEDDIPYCHARRVRNSPGRLN